MMKLDDLIGKPYKNNARGPNAFDCWGLVLEVMRRAGVYIPDIEVPADEIQKGKIVSVQKRDNFIRLNGPEPFCLVLFRITDDKSKIKWHVGVVLENCCRFIHTTGKMGVNISGLGEPVWRLFIEGFYKYNGKCLENCGG